MMMMIVLEICMRSCEVLLPHVGSGVVRIDPLYFLAVCRKRRLNHAPSVSYLNVFFIVLLLLFIRAPFMYFLFLLVCVLIFGYCS